MNETPQQTQPKGKAKQKRPLFLQMTKPQRAKVTELVASIRSLSREVRPDDEPATAQETMIAGMLLGLEQLNISINSEAVKQ